MVLEEEPFQELCIGGTDEKLETEPGESYYRIHVEEGNKVNPDEGGTIEIKEEWDI